MEEGCRLGIQGEEGGSAARARKGGVGWGLPKQVERDGEVVRAGGRQAIYFLCPELPQSRAEALSGLPR
jgi:hypothetical protein